MKQVHVECKPDEQLVTILGITRKFITHHQGKSRVFAALGKSNGLLAIVDEDPGSIKTKYENSLILRKEFEGIKYYTDATGNIVLSLKGKLEDWIIMACKKQKISTLHYGLPEKPNDLHDVINDKLSNFSQLINVLIKEKNPAVLKLKSWIN
jgi:hypothetical protein